MHKNILIQPEKSSETSYLFYTNDSVLWNFIFLYIPFVGGGGGGSGFCLFCF